MSTSGCEMALTRDRDVEYTARGTHARVPLPELHWGVFGDDDGKSRLAPRSQVHAGEFAHVDLPTDRRVKP